MSVCVCVSVGFYQCIRCTYLSLLCMLNKLDSDWNYVHNQNEYMPSTACAYLCVCVYVCIVSIVQSYGRIKCRWLA